MAIPDDLLEQAIDILADVEGVEMDAEGLADDVVLLAYALSEEIEFRCAVVSVHDALQLLVDGAVEGAVLKYQFAEWRSFHFQHRRLRKARADMRIVYQRTGSGIRVKGFGHRHLPSDIYRRLSEL